jgi:hypothetical protein
VRDAATIFDENAALLVARDPSLIEDLRGHRWHEVFVARRAEFVRNCEVWLFGHALMEKLVAPFKAITAHAWPVLAGNEIQLPRAERQVWLDEAVATSMEHGLATSEFTPLPVLGIPGWADGQNAEFYADTTVFRPQRRRR